MAIDKDLHEGEKIVLETHPHRWVYAKWYAFGVLLLFTLYGIVIGMPYLALGALLGFLVILIVGLLRRANKYYLTTKRVIHEYRLITGKISSTFYNKIQDIHFTQNPFERILGIGTIYVNTSGTDNIEITLTGVTPEFKKTLEEHIGKHHAH